MPKAKPARTPAQPGTGKRRAAQPEPVKPVQPELRWQRTQRYSWDKGGSKGGRK
jgi:hypothetical protein